MTIKETCSCGATLEADGADERWVAQDWRNGHKHHVPAVSLGGGLSSRLPNTNPAIGLPVRPQVMGKTFTNPGAHAAAGVPFVMNEVAS